MTQITTQSHPTLYSKQGKQVPPDVVTTFYQCMERAWECAGQSNRSYITWEVLKTVAFIATKDRDDRWALINHERAQLEETKVDGRLRLTRP